MDRQVGRPDGKIKLNLLFLAESPVSGAPRLILYGSKFFVRQFERPDGTKICARVYLRAVRSEDLTPQ